eukprot:TRINITY_DN3449_c0_g2_i1.p1 TRINITY_DN3449_c0_g2~~TRINITY_DN3449_c0_g2_i1.p1  ORF type:complete len:344 (-),score=76.73 TRINITY_DN3449_c0_g2_i1:20-988(-)
MAAHPTDDHGTIPFAEYRKWNPVMAFGLQAVAGMVEKTLVFPLDTVKTRLQLETARKKKEQRYRGVLRTLRTVVREEGFFRAYRGLSVPLASFPALLAVRLYSAEGVRQMLLKDEPKVLGAPQRRTTHANYGMMAIAGAICGAVETAVIAPVDIAKVRLQAAQVPGRPEEFVKGYADVYPKLWQHGGVAALYRGASAVLLRQMIYGAAIFTTYEWMSYQTVVAPEGPYGFKLLLCGTTAGLVATLAGAPLDVAKTRLQKGEADSLLGALRSIVSNEGVRGLYRGAKAKMYKVTVGTFAFLWAYELLVRTIVPQSELLDKIRN